MKALTKKRSQNWLLTFFLRIKLATAKQKKSDAIALI
jgi:hypothetical protein